MYKKIFSLILILVISNSVFSQLTAYITLPDGTSYCYGDSVLFVNSSEGTYISSHWRFGDNLDTWKEHPTHIFQQNATFTVWLIITSDSGIQDSTSVNVTINPSPIITLINNTEDKSLTAQTNVDDAEFVWYYGQAQTDETSPVIFYLESGFYAVTASYGGCSDSTSINIYLADTTAIMDIIVENNILTPDVADGANDVLFIRDLAFFTSQTSVYVYNKWGQMVYNNDNYSNLGGFNGTDNSGKNLDGGTYYYVIKCPERKTTTGYIDLIR